MNKIGYQKPMAEFVQFSNEDVVITSGCGAGGNGNMTCYNRGQADWDDECFVLGTRCFYGVFNNDGCSRTGGCSRIFREGVRDDVPCGKSGIMDVCGTASKAGQTWDCENNWTNFYSEP